MGGTGRSLAEVKISNVKEEHLFVGMPLQWA